MTFWDLSHCTVIVFSFRILVRAPTFSQAFGRSFIPFSPTAHPENGGSFEILSPMKQINADQ